MAGPRCAPEGQGGIGEHTPVQEGLGGSSQCRAWFSPHIVCAPPGWRAAPQTLAKDVAPHWCPCPAHEQSVVLRE